MSGSDLALVLVAIVAIAAIAALTVVCVRLAALTRELRELTDRFRRTVEPAAADLAESARLAGRQVDRLDDVIRTTGHLTETVDSATQATLRALSNPVIKTAALASGTSRAARRLRGRGTTPPGTGES